VGEQLIKFTMKKSVKILLFIVFFFAVAGIGAALYLFNMQHKDLQKAKPDYVITSTDIQKAFEDNESAATAKYVNKIIEVSGTIESVKPGEGNILNVTLKTGSDLSSVICTFPRSIDSSKFDAGGKVTIRGECSGFLMDVLLNNCSLIKKDNEQSH
jgi:hypothetical protein